MASGTSSKSFNPNTPEVSSAKTPSPRTNAGEIFMSVSRSHSSSNSASTPPHTNANAKNKGFCFPYTYQGTTYYTRPPPLLPSPLPYDGWIPFYPMNQTMDNGYNIAQSNEYSYHYGHGYIQPFSTGYSSPHYGYSIPHYNNLHQHFYNYNCSNNYPLHTPYINGNKNTDLSAPFTNQSSQTHGIRSGLLSQQSTLSRPNGPINESGPAGNGEWRKKKKSKRNKRKKYNKSKENKNAQPAHSGDEAETSEGVSDEANGNQTYQNGQSDGAYTDGKQIHDNDDVDCRTISDYEAESQVDSVIAVPQNGKTGTFDGLDGDLFCEYTEAQSEVKSMNNRNEHCKAHGNSSIDAEAHSE